MLEHRARKKYSDSTYVKSIVRNYLIEQMDELSSDFPFVNQSDILDIVNLAASYIEQYVVNRGKFTSIRTNEIEYMIKRESFLSVPSGKAVDGRFREVFKNAAQAEVDAYLSEERLEKDKYLKTHSSLCNKCAAKDICLEIFRRAKK